MPRHSQSKTSGWRLLRSDPPNGETAVEQPYAEARDGCRDGATGQQRATGPADGSLDAREMAIVRQVADAVRTNPDKARELIAIALSHHPALAHRVVLESIKQCPSAAGRILAAARLSRSIGARLLLGAFVAVVCQKLFATESQAAGLEAAPGDAGAGGWTGQIAAFLAGLNAALALMPDKAMAAQAIDPTLPRSELGGLDDRGAAETEHAGHEPMSNGPVQVEGSFDGSALEIVPEAHEEPGRLSSGGSVTVEAPLVSRQAEPVIHESDVAAERAESGPLPEILPQESGEAEASSAAAQATQVVANAPRQGPASDPVEPEAEAPVEVWLARDEWQSDDDVLVGSGRADFLFGGDGHDVLLGAAGDDWLFGGLQDDLLAGGLGDDALYGGDGKDELYGEEGDDWLNGGHGDDRLFGDLGDDRLQGSLGDDAAYGGSGNDWLAGHKGDDWLDGGAGDDSLSGGAGVDHLDGGAGTDWLAGGTGGDSLVGGAGDDELHGDDGYDRGSGGAGDDRLFGGNGGDLLEGDDGADILVGGAGHDRLRGGSGDDSVDGGSGSDFLEGGRGNDRLSGGDGYDLIFGHAGDDVADGGSGDDLLSGDAGADSLSGGAGHDRLYGGADDDWLRGGLGEDTLNGGAGDDRYLLSADDDGVDLIVDSEGINRIELDGFDPDTRVWAVQRDGGSLEIFVYEPDGAMRAVAAVEDFADNPEAFAGVELNGREIATEDLIEGSDLVGDGDDWFRAGPADDTIHAGAGDDSLSGGGGDDRLFGADGQDALAGDRGDDRLVGGDGDDRLEGGIGDDWLAGDAGDDQLFGGDGADWLIGRGGSDLLDGGAGSDRLEGGAGSDTYVITSGETGIDVIADEIGLNLIRLRGFAPEDGVWGQITEDGDLELLVRNAVGEDAKVATVEAFLDNAQALAGIEMDGRSLTVSDLIAGVDLAPRVAETLGEPQPVGPAGEAAPIVLEAADGGLETMVFDPPSEPLDAHLQELWRDDEQEAATL